MAEGLAGVLRISERIGRSTEDWWENWQVLCGLAGEMAGALRISGRIGGRIDRSTDNWLEDWQDH